LAHHLHTTPPLKRYLLVYRDGDRETLLSVYSYTPFDLSRLDGEDWSFVYTNSRLKGGLNIILDSEFLWEPACFGLIV